MRCCSALTSASGPCDWKNDSRQKAEGSRQKQWCLLCLLLSAYCLLLSAFLIPFFKELPMNPPVPPFWFTQRQGKLTPVEGDWYRLTAPNQGEASITVRQGENGCYAAVLRLTAEGPDTAVTEPIYDNLPDAWGAAFELYRREVVV
jgi:hypothetical protein